MGTGAERRGGPATPALWSSSVSPSCSACQVRKPDPETPRDDLDCESNNRLIFVDLCPPEQPPGFLTLTPNSRQVWAGQPFTLRCPQAQALSPGWMLRHFCPGRRVRKRVLHTDRCSPRGGAAVSDTCTFTAASENSGLYWCEGAEGRSNAVYVTVSSESFELKPCPRTH